MHHDGHTQGGGCPKCVINTRLIAAITPVLAAASQAADQIRDETEAARNNHDFNGCEHATQLVSMTREVLEDIAEMVAVKGK